MEPSGKRTMEGGGLLFSAGDTGSSIYLIKSGLMLISSESGGTKTSRAVGPGCVLGEDAIMNDPYAYSAECLEKTSLEEYRVSDLEGGDILRGLATMHAEAWRDRVAAQEGNLKVRLVHALIELSKGGEKLAGGWVGLDPSVTHAMIADMIGSSRSTVTAYINDWRKRKQGIRVPKSGSGMVEINPEKLISLRGNMK